MTEPEFPYHKHPPGEEPEPEPGNKIVPPPPPPQPGQPPGQPPVPQGIGEAPSKYTCKICGKTFNSKEELSVHMHMEHKSPKKKV